MKSNSPTGYDIPRHFSQRFFSKKKSTVAAFFFSSFFIKVLYRGSPLSTNSLSTIPGIVRQQIDLIFLKVFDYYCD